MRNRIQTPLETLTDVSQEPVDLDQVKGALKINYDDDDELLSRLIIASREMIEKALGVSIGVKQLRVFFSHDGCFPFSLPYGPVKGIVTVVRQDCDMDGVKITTTQYTVAGDRFKGQQGYYTVTYNAGFDPVPVAVSEGITKQVAWMYENRGDSAGSAGINKDVLFQLAGYKRNSWI